MGWRGTRLRTPDNEQMSDSFDARHWGAEIEDLVTEMTRLDPRGGCWEWIKGNFAEKWTSLLAEMKLIDTAFERKADEDLRAAVTNTRRLYRECIESWERRRGENVKESR